MLHFRSTDETKAPWLTAFNNNYAIYLGADCAYPTGLRGTFGTYFVTMAKVPGAFSIRPKKRTKSILLPPILRSSLCNVSLTPATADEWAILHATI
jgi:hypothetical protein